MTKKTYSKLVSLDSFQDRYEYLRLIGSVAGDTFGGYRYLNQSFYQSPEWRHFRNDIILRDKGLDLAFPGRLIQGRIVIHHLNPISIEDLLDDGLPEALMDPENVVCVSHLTHNAIHYGDSDLLYPDPIERRPNDTCPWKGGLL